MVTGARASASTRTAGSLLSQLAEGRQRAAVTFAGQGAEALTELSTLVAQHPQLRAGLEVASAVLADAIGSPEGQASGRFRHGADLVAWADDPDAAPADAYLRSASVSYPLILVTQALLWQALWEEGLSAAVGGGAIVAARRPLAGAAGRAARGRGRAARRRRRAARALRAARVGGRHARRAAHAGRSASRRWRSSRACGARGWSR